MSGHEHPRNSRHDRHGLYVGRWHFLLKILSVLCVSNPEPHTTVAK
jgi:hypothetical protein